MNVTSLRTILFDVDGTLLESNEAHAWSWSDASARFGFPKGVDFFRPLIGMGGDRVLPLIDPSLNEDSGLGKEIAEQCQAIYNARYFPKVGATRGARALVRRFHDEGWTCVVATSGTAEGLAAALERIGITEYIDHAATSNDAKASKPAPDIIQAALEQAKTVPRDAILLGDTPYDIEAAAAAEVRSVALRAGGWPDETLRGAAMLFDDPQDMLERFDWTSRSIAPIVR